MVDYSQALTDIAWANSEFMVGECPEAVMLLERANENTYKLAPNPFTADLKTQIKAAQDYIQDNQQVCMKREV